MEAVKEKYYQPEKLRYRHLAIMERMLQYPERDQNTLATELGYTPSRFSIIINSPLFRLAWKKFQEEHQARISEVAAEATLEAIEFSRGVVRGAVPANGGTGEIVVNDVKMRQDSARDLLNLGHAKAVDRRRNELEVGPTLEDVLRSVGEQKIG